MILETVKPSVFFRDALIQPGDVIVATPVADTSGPPDAQAT
jgi:type II secretory pathway component PulC